MREGVPLRTEALSRVALSFVKKRRFVVQAEWKCEVFQSEQSCSLGVSQFLTWK